MKTTPQLEALKKRISEELGACNATLWPKLCALRISDEGYHKIEEMVIRYVASEAMPIGSALALIEQELQHNYID